MGKSLSASEINVSSTKIQKDHPLLLYVDVAQTIFFKESLLQLMRKTVVFICWVSKTFVYTVAVVIYASAKLKQTFMLKNHL